MATLTTEELDRINRGLLRINGDLLKLDCLRDELYSAIVYTDQWIDDNQGNFASSFPEPDSGDSTALQKTIIFCVTAVARTGHLDWLYRLLGQELGPEGGE